MSERVPTLAVELVGHVADDRARVAQALINEARGLIGDRGEWVLLLSLHSNLPYMAVLNIYRGRGRPQKRSLLKLLDGVEKLRELFPEKQVSHAAVQSSVA